MASMCHMAKRGHIVMSSIYILAYRHCDYYHDDYYDYDDYSEDGLEFGPE